MFLPKSCLPFFWALPLPLSFGSLFIQVGVAEEVKPLCSMPGVVCQKIIPSPRQEIALKRGLLITEKKRKEKNTGT